MQRKKVTIIGGGAAGLKAAYALSPYFEVAIYEKAKTIGRKFLVAGKGGFNLTNSAQGEALIQHYDAPAFISDCLRAFDTSAVRAWLSDIQIPTYVGSSGRVFPEQGMKPYEVLKAIKNRLIKQGVQFYTQHQCIDFKDDALVVQHGSEQFTIPTDYTIFALGGASWPVTGSDGTWATMFEANGIALSPFQASNCGINIEWPESVTQYHEGKPLKNIRISVNGLNRMGETLITRYGLEGNAIYPLIPAIRQMLETQANPCIYLDFKPNNSLEQLAAKISGATMNTRDYAEAFKLDGAELAILKAFTDKHCFINPHAFAQAIKNLPLPVHSLRPIREAISTTGGVQAAEMNADFSLKKYPHVFAIGEMLDWDAPTGGFLLQACFSMAHCAATAIIKREGKENNSEIQ
ncbi:MAG: TIGR03862 family flavoprotein [Bacteroidota bacterium]